MHHMIVLILGLHYLLVLNSYLIFTTLGAYFQFALYVASS